MDLHRTEENFCFSEVYISRGDLVENPVIVNNGTVNALQSHYQGLGIIIFIQQSKMIQVGTIFSFTLTPSTAQFS